MPSSSQIFFCCLIETTFEAVYWIFHFIYCILHLQNLFLSLFYEFYFLLNFLFQSCILSWVHWFVYLCFPESCWASLKLFSILSQIMCRLYPWVSCWSITDISAFEGTFISFWIDFSKERHSPGGGCKGASWVGCSIFCSWEVTVA